MTLGLYVDVLVAGFYALKIASMQSISASKSGQKFKVALMVDCKHMAI